jgi:hypothetical protein
LICFDERESEIFMFKLGILIIPSKKLNLTCYTLHVLRHWTLSFERPKDILVYKANGIGGEDDLDANIFTQFLQYNDVLGKGAFVILCRFFMNI